MWYQRVIITGASSGFGMEFARRAGASCSQMILVARRVELLEDLKRELQAAFEKIEVECICCDLADESARNSLIEKLSAPCSGNTLLINNAGLGDYGEFAHSDAQRNKQMMMVNMVALTDITHALLPQMEKEGGAIINISSLASEFFLPDFAVYAATKAYVSAFSEALRLECRDKNIPILTVCPGPVHTGFGETARRDGYTGNTVPGKDYLSTSIAVVVNGSLRALQCNKARYFPSIKVKLFALLMHFTPRWVQRLILTMRPRRVSQLADKT